MNGDRLNTLEERVAGLELEVEKLKAELEASRGPSPGFLVSLGDRNILLVQLLSDGYC